MIRAPHHARMTRALLASLRSSAGDRERHDLSDALPASTCLLVVHAQHRESGARSVALVPSRPGLSPEVIR